MKYINMRNIFTKGEKITPNNEKKLEISELMEEIEKISVSSYPDKYATTIRLK